METGNKTSVNFKKHHQLPTNTNRKQDSTDLNRNKLPTVNCREDEDGDASTTQLVEHQRSHEAETRYHKEAKSPSPAGEKLFLLTGSKVNQVTVTKERLRNVQRTSLSSSTSQRRVCAHPHTSVGVMAADTPSGHVCLPLLLLALARPLARPPSLSLSRPPALSDAVSTRCDMETGRDRHFLLSGGGDASDSFTSSSDYR